MRDAQRLTFTDADVIELKDAEKNSFWFLTFLHLNHMGNTAKRQQFELAYMLDGKGLTDTGRNILASLDIGVGKGTFADFKQQYINKAEIETRYVILLPFCTFRSSFFFLCFVFVEGDKHMIIDLIVTHCRAFPFLKLDSVSSIVPVVVTCSTLKKIMFDR